MSINKPEALNKPIRLNVSDEWGVEEIRERFTLHQDAQPDREDVDFLLSVIDRVTVRVSPSSDEVEAIRARVNVCGEHSLRAQPDRCAEF